MIASVRRLVAVRRLVVAGSAGAALTTAHTAWNLRRLRVPPAAPGPVTEAVSVLLPVRDEAHRVGPCLHSLLASTGLTDLEILVLDDGSCDGTAEVVRRIAGRDPRLRLIAGAPLPAGWLGKPHACAQLAAAAGSTAVLVFIDADVIVEPDAIARTVGLLRAADLQLISPYPRQLAESVAERLMQPLLQWSWLSFLPLALAERSARPSLAAANGQLLAVDAAAYRRSGGHDALRAAVLEDIALLRALKRAGYRGAVADGTALACCRMYAGWPQLREGYAKSLWAAFGSPAGAAGCSGCSRCSTFCLRPPRSPAAGPAWRATPRASSVGRWPLAVAAAGCFRTRWLTRRRSCCWAASQRCPGAAAGPAR